MKRGDIVADRYLIEARAGATPSGQVFKVRDETGAITALKLISYNAVRRAGGIDTVSDRIDAIASIEHPGVVRYLDHGPMPDGRYFATTQWRDGVDLHSRSVSHPLSAAETAALAARLTDALIAIHAAGVLHRAIHPGNVLLEGGDPTQAMFVDFELGPPGDPAFGMEAEAVPLADEPGLLQTRPLYLSPEQVRGEIPDERSDLFSLGCVLHECLTGAPAFASYHPLATRCKILFDDAPRLADPPHGVPVAFAALVGCMLAKVREGRPQNATELALALSRLPVPAPSGPRRTRPPITSVPEQEQRFATFVVAVRSPDISSGRDRTDSAGDIDDDGRDSGTFDADTAPLGQFSALIMAYGARLDTMRGGSLVAILQGAGTGESRSTRAVRCAQAMQRELGAATAAIATGRGANCVGDAVDRAFGLLAGELAPGAAVVMDEATADLATPRFDTARSGPRFTLVGERAPAGALVLGRAAPFVGRSRELATLSATLEECLSERVARAVLVTGMSGFGKSRLRHEFVEHVGKHTGDIALWTATGHPIRPDAPMAVAADLIRRIVGVVAGDPPERVRRAIATRVEAVTAEAGAAASGVASLSADIAVRACDFLGELLGAPAESVDAPPGYALAAGRREPALMSDHVRRAISELTAAEAARRPVVIVIDDMQWCDRATADLIDQLLGALAERPFLVVAFGRPEMHDKFHDLWVRHGRTELSLSGLTRRAAEKLVRSVLGSDIDHRRVAALLRCADGNTFYLEELIRSAANGRWDLPDTAVAMVHARLAALAPPARAALRAASVFGDVFWAGGVRALQDDVGEVADWLQLLVDSELIAPRDLCTLSGQTEYEFRDAVVRENIYAMIRHSDRRQSHRAAGEWLAGAGEPEPQTVAEHLARGGEPGQALTYHIRAARRALSFGGWEVAVQQADRAVACGARDRDLGEARRIQALAHAQRRDHGEALRAADEALGLLPTGSYGWCQVAAAAIDSASRRRELERADAIIDRLLSVRLPNGGDAAGQAESAGDHGGDDPTEDRAAFVVALAQAVLALSRRREIERARAVWSELESVAAATGDNDAFVVAHVHLARAQIARADGDLAAARVGLERAAARLDKIGHVRRACEVRIEMGRLDCALGRYAEAERVLQAAYEQAQALGLDEAEHEGAIELAVAEIGQGAARDAQARLVQAAAWHDERRRERGAAWARIWQARLALDQGDLDTGERKARAAVAALTDEPPVAPTGAPRLRPLAEAMLAEILLARGRGSEALAIAGSARRAVDADPGACEGEGTVRMAYIMALGGVGDNDRAMSAVREAHGRLMARAAAISDPGSRDSFLRAVAVHARTVAMYEIRTAKEPGARGAPGREP